MKSRVMEFLVLAAFLFLASASLYTGSRTVSLHATVAGTTPFHCDPPPGVSPAEAGCRP